MNINTILKTQKGIYSTDCLSQQLKVLKLEKINVLRTFTIKVFLQCLIQLIAITKQCGPDSDACETLVS